MQMQSRPSRAPVRNADASRTDSDRIVDAVRSLNHNIRVSARAVEKQLGISSAQLQILQELAERPAQSINALAENTFTHQSSVSMVVRRLLDSGLVKREHPTGDARRVSVSLTPLGRSLVRRAPVTAHSRLLAGLRSIPRAELRSIAACFETVANLAGQPDSK
jgi:DNA-binding MarR family transcriptional regulator